MLKIFKAHPKKALGLGLVMAVLFQMIVLATEYLSSVWPLWYGTPVVLKTEPVDPRSLFRGNYVRLNYAASRIDAKQAQGRFKRGDVGYMLLIENEGIYEPAGLFKEPPENGLFLKGRITRTGHQLQLKYGIEAFFMPKEKALAAEKSVRRGAKAEIFIAANGKAAINQLILN
ncbi:MAG: GDYXXLXY domain-containing protein [Motiliproteus sp.]|nr:GDYXXLXY domain-containing protein [Motiliproteus sp.]MCW9052422.1 GDYXXLXY domain-containing protein [Motiliproteus sp.]